MIESTQLVVFRLDERRYALPLAVVERILAAEDPATQTGDPDKLKAAVAALDEATRPLAELLMDRAMEALLRKRGLIHP